MEEVVHIRYIPKGNVFQLSAPLNQNIEDFKINEEIITECAGSETIGSLLQKTKNKIKNIILDRCRGTGKEPKLGNNDVQICFKRKRVEGYKMIPEKLKLSVIMSQDHRKTRMTILDQEFRLMINTPKIYNFVLPPILYALSDICPIKFDGLNIENTLCKFNWYRSQNKLDWEKVGGTYFYQIKLDDVGYFLKMTCVPVSKEKVEGPSAETESMEVVLECPEVPHCPFDVRHKYTPTTLSEQSYRVVTYNTLSSRYTYNNPMYSYCPGLFLSIDYRKKLILKEIVGYNADIICLQEVDEIQYYRFFKPELEKEGYTSKFYRKGFYLAEGLMCAVQRARLKLKSYEQVVFCNAIKKKEIYRDLYEVMKRDERLMKKFSIQSPSLLILLLKCTDKKRILLGNIHMSHHVDNDDIRLIHSYMAIRCLKFMKEKLESIQSSYKVNIILCGDFNSPPNSAVYDFICKGKLAPRDYLKGRRLKLQHNLSFKSACGTPKYTIYTPYFKNCVDYIFIEDKMFDVQQNVPYLEFVVEQYVGIPNQLYPSDHMASVADVKFNK